MKRTLFLFSLLKVLHVSGQETINLEQCYKLAEESYPLTAQKELLKQSSEVSIKNTGHSYLPQVDLNAQATYQSDVTEFPSAPGSMGPEPLSKDQYKATIDVRQLIYDGGITRNQKDIQAATLLIEQQKLEVELYKIKERVNQLYFNILLSDENFELIGLLQDDITTKLKKIEAGVRGQVLLESNADVLKAELLKLEQRAIEVQSNREAAIKMLGELINKELPANTVLAKPELKQISPSISVGNRPETMLFKYQEEQLSKNHNLLNSKNLPRVSAFAQGGYGRPGLNMLDNSFQPFYIAGVKVTWSIWDWNTTKNDKQIIGINKSIIQKQKEVFEKNIRIALQQNAVDISKLNRLIEKDKEIIQLRKKIKNTVSIQLDNGIITSNDFLTELNAENQAILNLKTHELQLLMAQVNFITTQGN